MNNLPGEILHKIFIQLDLSQRLECMFVCRYWYNSLHKRSLLYDVYIRGNEKFSKFISMLHCMPGRGCQVETLELVNITTIDKRILCNILPNLRVFTFYNYSYDKQYQNYCRLPLEPLYPNSKLESITDRDECELTRQLLMFHSCTRLRRLELDLEDIKKPRKDLFIHLKNVPALKELNLKNCRIGIEDCEIIHKDVPDLETLILYQATLLPSKFPSDIIPASSVTRLHVNIYQVANHGNQPNWYKYMAKKYTNLKVFNSDDEVMARIDSRELVEIYLEGLFPLYKNVGRHIDNFSAIDIPLELDAFNRLDQLGLGVSYFNLDSNEERPIFEQLAESNQSRYAKSIKLTKTVIASPIMLQSFTALTDLYIDSQKLSDPWIVDLTDFFNAFPPTLTTFVAHLSDVDIRELPSHSNNIETFSLFGTMLLPKLAEALSKYSPKLNCLTLYGFVTENLDFNLPNNHFKFLDITALPKDDISLRFSVTETSSTQSQCPATVPDSSTSSSLESVSSDEFKDQTIINIKYTSAETFHTSIGEDENWLY